MDTYAMSHLHSEYRSTYRWHEYTGPRQQEQVVVRKPPQPTQGQPSPQPEPEPRVRPPGAARRIAHEDHLRHDAPDNSGPILPRRRKHPVLAYRCNEVLGLTAAASEDCLDSAVGPERHRSRPSPRKTGKKMVAAGASQQPSDAAPAAPAPVAAAGVPSGSLAGRHVPTEYRLQFAWRGVGSRGSRMEQGMAPVHTAAAGKASGVVQSVNQAAPRKSLSMGALKAQQLGQAAVHRSRVTDHDRAEDGESEPLMSSQDGGDEELRGEEKIREEALSKEEKPRHRKEFKTEYKKKFRPFSQYEYVEGRFTKRKDDEPQHPQPVDQTDSWYGEVIELRKKAGEYKHRGWGTELVPQHISELYNKQMLLWEQVSRRSSLSALSLATVSTPRSISKEEKDKENSRKSSPTKPVSGSLGRQRPQTAQPKLPGVHERSKSEKAKRSEKLEAPRTSRKEFPLRHHLERTTGAEDGALLLSPTREKLEPVAPRRRDDAPPTSSPKRLAQTGRSQSLGPAGAPETRSPKRAPRAPSATPKPQLNGTAERRARPTTLNTTAPSRSKSRTSAPSKGDKSQPSSARTATSGRGDDKQAVPRPKAKPASGEQGSPGKAVKRPTTDGEKAAEPEVEAEAEPEPAPTPSPEPDLEPIVKSPPEPTRVKSPEQIIMRSPEPVNWTVPLDTGKTFTVTQNVLDGHTDRQGTVPSPAPPASAKSVEPAEADLLSNADDAPLPYSPSPVPPSTASVTQVTSSACSELGDTDGDWSRVASPATMEVMSICQNGNSLLGSPDSERRMPANGSPWTAGTSPPVRPDADVADLLSITSNTGPAKNEVAKDKVNEILFVGLEPLVAPAPPTNGVHTNGGTKDKETFLDESLTF